MPTASPACAAARVGDLGGGLDLGARILDRADQPGGGLRRLAHRDRRLLGRGGDFARLAQHAARRRRRALALARAARYIPATRPRPSPRSPRGSRWRAGRASPARHARNSRCRASRRFRIRAAEAEQQVEQPRSSCLVWSGIAAMISSISRPRGLRHRQDRGQRHARRDSAPATVRSADSTQVLPTGSVRRLR